MMGDFEKQLEEFELYAVDHRESLLNILLFLN